MLVRPCSGCGFGNELDDVWCGGCARALAPRSDRLAAVQAPVAAVSRARAAAVVPAAVVPAAVGPATPDTLPALLLAINRGGATTAAVDDVQDQDALDALFGEQP